MLTYLIFKKQNTMNRNILKTYLNSLGAFASLATLHSYFNQLDDKKLQDKLSSLEKQNKILETKINDSKIEDLQSEILKSKLDLLKINFKECNLNSNREIELLKSIDTKSTDFQNKIEYHTNNFIKENESTQNLIDEFLTLFIDKDKFIGNGFPDINILFDKWNNILSNLTIEQLGAVSHIFSALTILLCLFTIISIVYSKFLINSFKLEEKYPKLSRILKIRKMFQHYYLILNFIFIISILLGIIIVNLKIIKTNIFKRW
uniref:hypothetical protein n=1 Tax=Amanita sinensis TaxID=67728 RepID=UPI001D0FBBE0|nr:hypothetical protein LK379_mgp13 [Amanita sinensis]QZN08176.1 hypothetical protein [Amanita sinensis]